MNIQTTRFGQIEVDPKQIITFPKGIPSFEEQKQFVLLPADENSPFYFLQSTTDADLCFFLVDPFVLFPTYQVEIDDTLKIKLEIENQEDVVIYTMMTIHDSLQNATTNLRAPLVFNTSKKLAQQIVIDNDDYLIKQPLFEQKTTNEQEQVAKG